MTVLVLAREFDPTADAVVKILADRRVPVFRADLSEFPIRLRLHAHLDRSGRLTGRLWNDYRSVRLEDIRSIWNRNPSTYVLAPELSGQEREFAYREAKLALGGILASLAVVWANHPNRCADALWKPYQWKIAASVCGLTVAETEITNDPGSARRFLSGRAPGGFATKALGPAGTVRDGLVKVAYTRRLSSGDVDALDSVAITATALQEFVPKAFEVRLTVIGDRWFPIAIEASTERARTDWRSDPDALTYKFVSVPDTVVDGVSAYMKHTGLAYAGLDFVVTPEGGWVLLEANTGPQFGWLEAATGAPMAAAMADLLAVAR
jgi:ATP-grasp ribosomal peptide maturase